jgi:hypothetical protein
VRRALSILVAMVAAFAIAGVALAGNAHYVGSPQIQTSGSTLTASGKIAGLGNIDQIRVVVTADAFCVNRGNKAPSAENKTSFTAEGIAPVQNGKALFEVSGTASFSPNCSPPMRVEFRNIQISVYDAATGEQLL